MFGCLFISSVILLLFSCFIFLPFCFDAGFVFGKVVLYISQFHVLVIVCFSCVVCIHFRHLVCIIVCLCCLVFSLNRTKWVFVCILWFSFLFVVLFWILSSFVFIPLKKRPPKTGHGKNPKKQKCRKKKRTKENKLAQWCSQIVFLFFGMGLKNADFCWKHYKNGFNIFWKMKKGQTYQKCWVRAWSKVASKLGLSMLRNIIGPSFDSIQG